MAYNLQNWDLSTGIREHILTNARALFGNIYAGIYLCCEKKEHEVDIYAVIARIARRWEGGDHSRIILLGPRGNSTPQDALKGLLLETMTLMHTKLKDGTDQVEGPNDGGDDLVGALLDGPHDRVIPF